MATPVNAPAAGGARAVVPAVRPAGPGVMQPANPGGFRPAASALQSAAASPQASQNPQAMAQARQAFQARFQGTQGQQQAGALANTGGALKEYMAARGATPIGTLGSGQPLQRQPYSTPAMQYNRPGSMTRDIADIGSGQRATAQFAGRAAPQSNTISIDGSGNNAGGNSDNNGRYGGPRVNGPPGGGWGAGGKNAGMMGPGVPRQAKGRTTSMQRRGVGAGQVPGQGVPTRRGGPVTSTRAAQNFIAGRRNVANPRTVPDTPATPVRETPATPTQPVNNRAAAVPQPTVQRTPPSPQPGGGMRPVVQSAPTG